MQRPTLIFDTYSYLAVLCGSTSGITDGGLLSEAQMKNPASYSGWDFVTVWQAGGGSYPYPTLR